LKFTNDTNNKISTIDNLIKGELQKLNNKKNESKLIDKETSYLLDQSINLRDSFYDGNLININF
jgi:hypothetical protein